MERRILESTKRFRPAALVRGSSRRMMTMREPANISLINRRFAPTFFTGSLFSSGGS